jgi:enoyl-[acyl-carrier protein] reductase III
VTTSVKGKWALVLGASSGFGEAISLKLAETGMNIVGVHLDRKSTLPHVEEITQKIRQLVFSTPMPQTRKNVKKS